MLALPYIRENTEDVKTRIAKKHPKYVAAIDEVMHLDEASRKAKAEMERKQAEANSLAKKVGELMKTGDKLGAEAIKENTLILKESVKVLEEESKLLEQKLFEVLISIPNLPHHSVPFGQTPEENENILQWGEIPDLPEGSVPHWDLIKKYD